MRPRVVLWLIIVLTSLAVWANLPPLNFKPQIVAFNQKFNLDFGSLTNRFPIKLGLDLEGGTELVLRTKMDQVAPDDRDTALESARQVIEKRVNLYGVSEAVVQSSKLGNDRRILVELPGVKDASAAANLVGKTAQLDFREVTDDSIKEASAAGAPVVFFAKPTGLTGADLRKAVVRFDSSGGKGGPQVEIEFTDEGAKKFAEITKRNIGKPLVIFLDDVPVEAPTVQQEIAGGQATISGGFTPQQAKELSIQLNAGALPVSIEILQQRFVGATLGNESVKKSLTAGVIGLAIVMVYMAAYYGLYGLMADLALIVYTLLVLAIFRTGLFVIPPVTLTLAGIAGFILSIGMAVDANILTFERMKEEFRAGKKGRMALEHGFNRAWTSIRDSNVSSLITALILYLFGTNVVRGFALTLSIGVLVSMISAIVVTRTFLRLLPRFKS